MEQHADAYLSVMPMCSAELQVLALCPQIIIQYHAIHVYVFELLHAPRGRHDAFAGDDCARTNLHLVVTYRRKKERVF